jgi:DNA-binding CsgD family transcriptional regulator
VDRAEDVRIVRHPGHLLALAPKWSGDLVAAKARFEALTSRAAERGEESSMPLILYHLAELECWLGDWVSALRHADEGCEIALQTGQTPIRCFVLYARALVDVLLGREDEARVAAREGTAIGERTGTIAGLVLNVGVLGFLELSLGNAAGADGYLRPLVDGVIGTGLVSPSTLRLFPDDIEALVALGEVDVAARTLEQYEKRVRALRWGWGIATAQRCQGLVRAAHGDLAEAIRALDRALHRHEDVPEPFELGRTLLVMGEVQRRAKQKRAARTYLGRALEVFQGLGARLWARRVTAELERAAGVPGGLDLTATERRVADLVALGHTNREVADSLFMSIKTVEVNLTRTYRKLGVRSRAELILKMRVNDASSITQG